MDTTVTRPDEPFFGTIVIVNVLPYALFIMKLLLVMALLVALCRLVTSTISWQLFKNDLYLWWYTYCTIFQLLSYCVYTVYPKKYAHGFCFAVLCCGYTLTDFPISIRLTSLALWLSNDCPSASKATLMNIDKYFMWIHYERLHNHNKAKHNKTVCIFLGIYCICVFIYIYADLFENRHQYVCMTKGFSIWTDHFSYRCFSVI